MGTNGHFCRSDRSAQGDRSTLRSIRPKSAGTRSPGRWREDAPPPAPPVSNRDDDLADLLVRLQVAVSLDDFLKRERLGDERLEAARGESIIHERLRPFQTLRVGRDLHHHVAANRDPLAQDVEQGEWRRLRAQRAVEEQDPQPGRRLRELREGRAADGVEYDTRAFAARDPDDLLHQVLLVGGDDMSRARVQQRLAFGLAPRQGDRNRPDPVGDLDGSQADAARSRGDQDRVALGQLAEVDERPVGREVLHPDRRRFGPRERGWVMRHSVDRCIRELAVEPVVVQREARNGADRVADLEPLDVLPDRGDGPRRLVPQTSRQLGLFQVLAVPEHRFGAVQPQRLDADLDLALAGRRDLDLLHSQDFRAADLMKPHDTRHVSLSCWGDSESTVTNLKAFLPYRPSLAQWPPTLGTW